MAHPGLKPGTSLRGGTYRIEKVLGQGSFGITYLATAKFTTQGNLGKMDVEAKVAIKEFFMSEVNGRSVDGSTVEGSSGSVFTNYRKKFKKEAENLSKLEHPNIVKVFDVFDENNTTYYVMEFLEGQNLDDYIKQNGFLEESEAIQIISEIGGALSYMHSKKMLHLDIKPKNIMRKSDGKDYLIDFGLSKQFTEDGEPESSTSIGLGTPGYAPIEQAGYKQDGSFPATLDVYALGATLFKMLTGKRPPEATYILNEGFPEKELKALGISDNTRNVLNKAMAPTKKERYQSIELLLDRINEEIAPLESKVHFHTEARPDQPIEQVSRTPLISENKESYKIPIQRRKWILPTIFAIVMIIAAVCLLPLISRCTQQNQIKDETRQLVRPDGRVSDINDYLTEEQKKILNNVNDSVSNATGLQIVSMILTNPQTNEFKLFNDSVFNSWGIGDSKKNNGVLIGIDVKGRQIAVTTGLGIPETNNEGISLWQTVVDSMQSYCKKGDYFNALTVGSLMTGKYKEIREGENSILQNAEQTDNQQPIKTNENKTKSNNDSKKERKETDERDERKETLNKAIKDGIRGIGQLRLLAEHEHYAPAYLYYAKNLLQQGKTEEAKEYLKKSIVANVNVSECKDLLEILNE